MKTSLKIFKLLFLSLILLLATTNCKKSNSPSSPTGNPTGKITIKGQLPKSLSTKSKTLNADTPLTLADAKKILVFSRYYYTLTDIVNNSFSVTGQIGTGIALIFLDANNKYIGNLSPQGLNILPLVNLKDGENTQIDLSMLTLVGTTVTPTHDPLGNEIQISPTEINCLKSISTYYQSITKNIDADNDGIPDVLSNKQLVISSIFVRNSGHWGTNSNPPVPTDTANSNMNYKVAIQGGSAHTFSNGNIVLSGPAASPYNDIVTWDSKRDEYSFFATFCRGTLSRPSFQPLKQGTYTLTLDGNKSFTLDYSNIDAKYNLVIIQPTLHTNNDGKLTSITFEYKLPNGSTINPASMLTNVMVCLLDSHMYIFYYSIKLTSSTGFLTLTPDSPIDLSTVNGLDVWYDDLLGNQYDIVWR